MKERRKDKHEGKKEEEEEKKQKNPSSSSLPFVSYSLVVVPYLGRRADFVERESRRRNKSFVDKKKNAQITKSN